MKTKIAYLTMALVIALSMAVGGLLVVQAPPVAASPGEVTNVWVQFTTSTYNLKNTATDFTIHFTPTTAMSRGVDTVTVWFPDGSTAMGPAVFILSGANTTREYYEVDRDGEASTYSAVECLSSPTLSTSGYRINIELPVDLDAGTPCSVRIEDDAGVACANSDSHDPYYVKVYTSKDTTPVLSDAFNIDATGLNATTLTLGEPYPGAAGQYQFLLDTTGASADLTAGEDTVTVIFPYGTTIPAAGGIAADQVSWSNNAGVGWSTGTALPVINQKARMITCTTPITLSEHASNNYIKFSTGAGIMNPTTATTYSEGATGTTWYVFTNEDELQVAEDGQAISARTTGTKMGFNNDPFLSGGYSDDATMINMYSNALYMEVQDAYGNLVDPTTEPIVTMSSDKSGAFYDYAFTQDNTIVTDADSNPGAAVVYFVPSAAGTHTITADASAYGYALGTWTLYVAPGVELRDSYDNLIKTYQAAAALPLKETTGNHSGDYVQSALSASITGDTVKLGGSSGNIGIYELDTLLTLDQKITLTSKSGSDDYTTLRPINDGMHAIEVTADGTATNPITISYLTFDRKVVPGGTNLNFDMALHNDGYDYVTVNGCTFNWVIPDNNSQREGVVWIRTSDSGAITSATISNNTFTNCGPLDLDEGISGRSVVVYGGSYDAGVLTGLSITGNRFTDCSEHNIELKGNGTKRIVANITDNYFTRGRNCINMNNTAGSSSPYGSVTITGNTFTTAYSYAIKVESGNGGVTIKNNTITGTVGTYAVTLEDPKTNGSAFVGTHYCQYNDIYDNQSYAIRGNSSTSVAYDCQYNWYGHVTGPAYTAATGAVIGKSNPGAGDPITDSVTYYPWLHTSKATVITDNASYQTSTVALVSGWNTLSTPVELIPTGDQLIELIPSGLLYIFTYSGGWVAQTTAYELTPCDAVYVKLSAAKTVQLKFDADERTTPEKALAVGWNMISLAYLSSSAVEADDAVGSVYLTAAGLPGYSQVVSPSLNTVRRDMYYNQGTSWSHSRAEHGEDTGSMYSTYGYWLYMLNAATLAGLTITPIAPDLD